MPLGFGIWVLAASVLDVLRQPTDTLAVALAHNNGAHEDLNGSDALERDLALASCNISVSQSSPTAPPTSPPRPPPW